MKAITEPKSYYTNVIILYTNCVFRA